MSKGRLEAFSDGVIAVAITLLVLNITVPEPPAQRPGAPPQTFSLAHALGQQWPSYAAYVISFLTIGIIWINHHAMINRLRDVDHVILILNLLLLMSIAMLPFATDLMARYLRESSGEHLAAGLYSGSFLVMSVFFTLLNRQILFPRSHLMVDRQTEEWRRRAFKRATVGVVPYAVATGLAVISPYLTLVICGGLAVFYALPIASSAADG